MVDVSFKGGDSGVRVGEARELGMCEMQGGRLQMLDVLHPSKTDETVKFSRLSWSREVSDALQAKIVLQCMLKNAETCISSA